MEVTNDVKGVMKERVKPYMGNKHATQAPQNKKIHKAEQEQESHINGKGRLYQGNTPMQNFR